MLKSYPFALALLGMLLVAPLLHAQKPLDNAAVIQLAASDQTEDQIVQTIAASAGHYDTGTDARAALKKAGVTDNEIAAMLKKNADTYAAAVAAVGSDSTVLPPGVHGIGVYYKDTASGMWVEFKPEMFYSATPQGAIIPSVGGGPIGLAVDLAVLPINIAYAINRQDNHGRPNVGDNFILGKEAQLQLNHPLDILIYAPEDTGPKDYLLVKLRADPAAPELRVFERGGSLKEAAASKRDLQKFKASKLGNRLYQFTLGPDYPPGEYGLLLPDAASAATSPGEGQILTFRVIE